MTSNPVLDRLRGDLDLTKLDLAARGLIRTFNRSIDDDVPSGTPIGEVQIRFTTALGLRARIDATLGIMQMPG